MSTTFCSIIFEEASFERTVKVITVDLSQNVAGLLNFLLLLLRKSNELRFGRRHLAGPLAAGACEGAWQKQCIICYHILESVLEEWVKCPFINCLFQDLATACWRTQQLFMHQLGVGRGRGVGPGPPLVCRSSHEGSTGTHRQPGFRNSLSSWRKGFVTRAGACWSGCHRTVTWDSCAMLGVRGVSHSWSNLHAPNVV